MRSIRSYYICGTALTDMWMGGPVRFYHTVKELKVAEKCWKECGIILVRIDNVKTIVKGKL